jgi:hypothetical protein
MNMTMHTSATMIKNIAIETKLYEKIVLTTYVVDFGNVVINYPK